MSKEYMRPPGIYIGPEKATPFRGIVFHPESRKFYWDEEPRCEVVEDPSRPLGIKIKFGFERLTSEEIAANIDDDTMAKCLAMAINASTEKRRP